MARHSRREFLAAAGKGVGAASVVAGFPSIVPSSVLGAFAPSNRINIGAIGNGRISRGHDLPGLWKYDSARIMAACDLDSHIHAVQAGKDVYLQKPASLTIAEGRALSDAVHRSGRIFQIGSQQRSSPQFRYAAELVRNGRIGQLRTVQIGLPGDPAGEEEPTMPVPKNLNYDMWLGSTPVVPYTEKRVHPQAGYDRPGWLRCEQFGAGMITGWGAHHIDSAHWGMDTEYTGPVEIWGTAEFPKSGLWDVHGPFRTEALYANGVHMIVSGDFPNGIRFEGTDGWIFVSRGNETVTASDPVAKLQDSQALAASDPKIIKSVIGPDEIHLYDSKDHHGNWLESIRSRQQPIAPVEVAHRACSACLLHHMAMKLERKLYWDPTRERFKNDDEANGMLSRPQRPPYTIV
ncbi:MAG: Gfo/Idh/MocA family oxidoreductase [Acidobacteria bacterium]|nr:Gfo/Idh/MocA family oxidoreductase [Acidobacteriota bacterium]